MKTICKNVLFLTFLSFISCTDRIEPTDDSTPDKQDSPSTIMIGDDNLNMPAGKIRASHSGLDADCGLSQLIDDDFDTMFATARNSVTLSWSGNDPATVTSYSLTSSSENPADDPAEWTLYGSEDNSSWTQLDHRTDITFDGRKDKMFFEIATPSPYRYYRMEITENKGGEITRIAEWYLSTRIETDVEIGQDNENMPFAGTVSCDTDDSPEAFCIGNLTDGDALTKFVARNDRFSIGYRSTEPFSIASYSIVSAPDAPEKNPSSWVLSGSEDGKEWIELDVRKNVEFKRSERLDFDVKASALFRHYRINVDANNGGSSTQIAEWTVSKTEVVSADFSSETVKCGNMLFGGCHVPSKPHAETIIPMLVDAGFNSVRTDMWLEKVLPSNITYEDYLNNINDIQNPDKWNFADLEQARLANQSGLKVMLIIDYCPGWLSYNGKSNGIPKDMDVYADIVRKVYQRYHEYVDWVEIYNEPGYFLTTENSPYSSKGKALADIYTVCSEVVREITPDMPIGGTSVVTWSDGGVGGSTNRDFFADKRITKENFNFYSHHVYGDYGIDTEKESVNRVRDILQGFGHGDVPIYFTEWSKSISNAADSAAYIGTESHTFTANCLVNWMREGLDGAMHWNFMEAICENGSEPGISFDAHGMYAWNVGKQEGRLLPKAYVFTLLSKTLGLGHGENIVTSMKMESADCINAISLINAEGERVSVFVNNSRYTVKISVTGIEAGKVLVNTVTYRDKGLDEVETDGCMGVFNINLPPMSVTGTRWIM